MSPTFPGNLEIERYTGACLISQNRTKFNRHQYYGSSNFYVNHLNGLCYNNRRNDGWLIPSIYHHQPYRNGDFSVVRNEPLRKLAVHTQGVPLILTRSYNYRKPKPNNKFVPINNKEVMNIDRVSISSDESTSSVISENCLPRIIKPRKRRKKDRKIEQNNNLPVCRSEVPELLSEIPKLQHSFDDIKEVNDNGNQLTTCQCCYCDPISQIWDIDRNCYSPLLTKPKTFNLSSAFKIDKSTTNEEEDCLIYGMSSMCLNVDKEKTEKVDLEISTEIVTSLNGHRDIEIRFFPSLPSASSVSTQHHESVKG